MLWSPVRLSLAVSSLVVLSIPSGAPAMPPRIAPPPAAAGHAATQRLAPVSSRTVRLTQSVTLTDIPAGASLVRLWVPIPSDGPFQRVLDREVIAAPPGWRLEKQVDGRGQMIYVEIPRPTAATATVTIAATVERSGVAAPLEAIAADRSADARGSNELLADELRRDAPLMGADSRALALADEACGDETDPARVALLLLKAVAAKADHYSKDPSKPTCGRGAASDCLDNGGGCCTDLHSLFIAMARAKGVPARIEFGYRLMPAKADSDKPYDPGYRCWVEFFVPGAGWIPTDIVAADAASEDHPQRFGSLSDTKVWLWHGRSFELSPPASAGRIDTMIVGWAEIDGVAVDPLPGADGTPSRLSRTVRYEVLDESGPRGPRLPE